MGNLLMLLLSSEDLWVNSAIALMWREELSRSKKYAPAVTAPSIISPKGAPAILLNPSSFNSSCNRSTDRERQRQRNSADDYGLKSSAAFPLPAKTESACRGTD